MDITDLLNDPRITTAIHDLTGHTATATQDGLKLSTTSCTATIDVAGADAACELCASSACRHADFARILIALARRDVDA